jgi:hypothetical protein
LKWKINRTMAIWGISFGIVASLTGMFVVSALRGGFLAEGFFLLILGWVFFLVLIAKIVTRLEHKKQKKTEE